MREGHCAVCHLDRWYLERKLQALEDQNKFSCSSTSLLSNSAWENEVRACEFLSCEEVNLSSFMSLRQKHSQGQNQTILKDNSKQTHTLSFGSVLGNMNVSGFVSCHRSTLSKTPNPLTQ